MFTYLAQILPHDIGGPLFGPGPLGRPGTTGPAVANSFEDLISKIIGVLTVSAVLWFLIMFFLGAIAWINAGGDAKAVEAARAKIFHALTGLVIVLLALIFTSVLGWLLGIEILNIGQAIVDLGRR